MLNPQRTTVGEDGAVEYHVALNKLQWDAWKVSSFMESARQGDARLDRYTVSPAEAARDKLKAEYNNLGQGRWCPPGEYIRLMLPRDKNQEHMDDDQCVDDFWYTMMSDTADEANDHADVIHAAWSFGGRVLIHGLGLGCVLNAILASPLVEHVDVVEVNADVIALVGPYFQGAVDDGRLTIHHDSCLTKRWPPHTTWSVVWHDIWSMISEDNLLHDHRAEWGISYATMHRKFGGRCWWQGSWGWEQARWLRDKENKLDRKRREFVFQWNTLWSVEERLDELCRLVTPALLNPDDYRAMLAYMPCPTGGGTLLDSYQKIAQGDIEEDDVLLLFR